MANIMKSSVDIFSWTDEQIFSFIINFSVSSLRLIWGSYDWLSLFCLQDAVAEIYETKIYQT